MACHAGKQFNTYMDDVTHWRSTFWQASDVSKESQPSVTDDCVYVWQTCHCFSD